MEEKNNKKGKLLYTLLGVTLLLALVGGAYAFFSASVSNSSIGGNTQNINNDSLTLTVKKVVFAGVAAPSNDLVPAYFGHNNNELVVGDPSDLTDTQVGNMLTNKCENNGFTGCHVYKITIEANQNITHANLLLNLSVSNLTGASNVVDKSQWGYVVFSGTETPNSSDNTKTDSITLGQNALNGAGHGGPAAIGNGVTALDIHNNSSLTTNTPVTYYLLVYVNDTGESQNTSTSGTGDEHYAVGTYSGSLELQALGGKVRTDFGPAAPQGPTAAEYITNLYTTAEKSQATVNGITYNLASSASLMNDRLASMSTDIDAGDIRYYGANPNNYVWLGDSYVTVDGYANYDNCVVYNNEEYCTENGETVNKLWRIIGVFDGRLKLIQADLLNDLIWDTSSSDVNSGYGINEWSQADLMKLLNQQSNGQNYTGINGSLYWNKGTGTVYTGISNVTESNVSFANTGLSEDEQDMIDTATWYLGAAENSELYVDQMYNAERQSSRLGCSDCADNVTRTATWNGKVGLMYPSDYGYATDLSLCSADLYNYDGEGCASNNWLFNTNMQWTMSPRADDLSAVFYLSESGYIKGDNDYDLRNVRPVIYLNTNVMIDIDGNDGSEAHPYRLFLS